MKTIEERNNLVVEYRYLADRLACNKKRKCLSGIQLADLKSAAYMGLIDAANKFDPNRGASFKHYARIRINGEISDYLRKWSGGRKKTKIVKVKSLFYENKDFQVSLLGNVSYEDKNLEAVDSADLYNFVSKNLTLIQRKVVYLYYFSGIPMKEIGKKIGYSESRISQIASDAREVIQNTLEVNGLC